MYEKKHLFKVRTSKSHSYICLVRSLPRPLYVYAKRRRKIVGERKSKNVYSNRNFQSFLVEMQKGAATLKETLLVSHKTKHTFNLLSRNHLPSYFPKVENFCLHKTLHIEFYRIFSHEC